MLEVPHSSIGPKLLHTLFSSPELPPPPFLSCILRELGYRILVSTVLGRYTQEQCERLRNPLYALELADDVENAERGEANSGDRVTVRKALRSSESSFSD